ncbi:MAG TPA: pseudaminic acid cytidylyltransferase [Rhodocyclaceae bacterium]
MKVAVIPARGGSKRIPRKNIRDFAGKPIIAHSIGAALGCGLFDRIIVSTDDEEIAAVARTWGAETPFVRPADLSNDFAGTEAVVKHCIEWLAGQGTPADEVCCIYATAPFVTADSLARGHRALNDSGRDYAFSAATFPFPVQRALRLLPGDAVAPMFPQYIECRSQDLDEACHDAGQFYWGKAQAWLTDVPLFSERAIAVLLPRHRVQDIDTAEDWRRAELLWQVLAAEEGKETT